MNNVRVSQLIIKECCISTLLIRYGCEMWCLAGGGGCLISHDVFTLFSYQIWIKVAKRI
jgi:hypothetical protein